MNKNDLKQLTNLLAQPTAPFREAHVVATVTRMVDRAGVPWFEDPVGNLVVGAASRTDYQRLIGRRSAEPLRVFIAHMDHPGFHGERWLSPRRLHIRWHGGAPVRHLAGARVWVADGDGVIDHGQLAKVKLAASRRMIATAEVRFDSAAVHECHPRAQDLYGGFAFRAPVWQSGERIYTKAADDLIGVFALVQTARKLFARGRRAKHPFIGLLTRAEEVGFVGAIAHFEQGWLQRARRPVVCVSLEASRTLPGALIGKGPIVRLGDRMTVFDPQALRVLTDVAEHVLPGAHQRRVMDGGACEASAATAYGFTTVGISVPLGNYHNQGFEGGPDCKHENGPAPEFVHVRDIDGMCRLCRALMEARLPWTQAWAPRRSAMRDNLRKYRALLSQR